MITREDLRVSRSMLADWHENHAITELREQDACFPHDAFMTLYDYLTLKIKEQLQQTTPTDGE